MRTSYRFSQYAKAGMVFAVTTATYFFTRASGFLPSWLNWKETEYNQLTVFEEAAHSTVEEMQFVSKNTNFATFEFESSLHQKQLLQMVSVVNPIPDQIINVQQSYQLSLNEVFSGDFDLFKAVETGKTSLPDWLSLQFNEVASYPVGGTNLVLSNDLLFLGNGNLLIFNVTNPLKLDLLATYYPSGGGNAEGIVVLNNIAFLAAGGGGLQILNMSVPTNPHLISTYIGNSSYPAYGVTVSGNTVFVAAENGLQIIDVSNITIPRLLSVYPNCLGGGAMGVTVSGNILFVGDGGCIQILNISDPGYPQLLSTYYTGPYANSVAVLDNIVLIGDGYYDLQILDINNITNPRLIGTYNVGFDGMAYQVAVLGNIAFVANNRVGLQILDITNPTQPTLISIQLPVSGDATYGIAVSESNLFILGYSNLQILDLTQADLIGNSPLNAMGEQVSITVMACSSTAVLNEVTFMLILDQIPYQAVNTLSDYSLFPDNSLSLLLSSDRFFINPGDSFLKLSILSSNGQLLPPLFSLVPELRLLSNYPENFLELTVGNNVLYGTLQSGFQILNINNPAVPILLTTNTNINTYGDDIGMAVSGNVLFVADISVGLQIFDVSNPGNPILIGHYPLIALDSFYQIIVSGNKLLYASLNGSPPVVQILDISNPSMPTLLNTYQDPLNRRVASVAAEANRLFIIVQDALVHLLILDMSNVTDLRLISTVDFESFHASFSMSVRDNTLFVAAINSLLIFDVSNPMQAIIQSTYGMGPSDFIGGMDVSGNTVFLACTGAGLQILDVSDSSNPRLITSYPGSAGSVTISGNIVFLADSNAGLIILDISEWQFTVTPNTSNVRNYVLQLTATDELGGSASTLPFTIRVEGPPQFMAIFPFNTPKWGSPIITLYRMDFLPIRILIRLCFPPPCRAGKNYRDG